jgi:oxygen-dependent protoporphyrinogen oxidase
VSRIGVIGAGIAGLSAAHRLSATHDVIVFECEPAAGGKIHSQKIDGFLFEWGPSTFLSSARELHALVGELGLSDELTAAPRAAKKRYIYWNGGLHALPVKPSDALRMTILSPLGKLRALREPFVRKGSGADDESVFAFMERRFGREVAERLVSPAVLGISGGDAAQTSLGALFPRLRDMEAEHGSVIRAMLASGARAAKDRRAGKAVREVANMYGFAAGGMQTLTDRLAQRLGDRLRTNVRVHRIAPGESAWNIVHDRGESRVDGVIVATPADAAAELVAGFDAELADRLRDIPYAPMRAVGVAFRREDVTTPLDGFGFLAARDSGVRLLGVFYTSAVSPEHAAPGTAYVRVFLVGATDPAVATLDAEAVRAIVLRDLRTTLGITAAPVAYHEVVWPRAIPQYRLRHRALVAAIRTLESAHAGFGLAGNAYRGLGLGDDVLDALEVAARIGGAVSTSSEQRANVSGRSG